MREASCLLNGLWTRVKTTTTILKLCNSPSLLSVKCSRSTCIFLNIRKEAIQSKLRGLVALKGKYCFFFYRRDYEIKYRFQIVKSIRIVFF